MAKTSTRFPSLPLTPKLRGSSGRHAHSLPNSLSRFSNPPVLSPSKSTPTSPTPTQLAFIQLKGQLKLADGLVSYNRGTGRLQTVPYPMWRDGEAVRPADLFNYVKTHDWPLPFCFCAVTTGIDTRTKLMQPHALKSEHKGDPCLTCPTYSCKYWVNVAHLVTRVGEMAPLQTFPIILEHSAALDDDDSDVGARGRDDEPVFPFTQAPRALSMVSLPRSSVSSPLAGKSKRQRLSNGFDEDKAYADDIDCFWSPPVDGMEFLRAHEHKILSDDEALTLLLKMADPKSPGITWADFIKIFSKCYGCSLIMTCSNMKRHTCPKSLMSKVTPSVKQEIIDLTDFI